MATSSSLPSPRIPIHTCEGLFEKLKWEYQRLQGEWNEYNSFNFIVTAYHLYCDWIDKAGSQAQKRRKNGLPADARKLFFVLRDITNASKHWTLDRPNQEKRVVDDVSDPKIADWDAYFNTGPVLYVSVNQANLSMPEVARLAVETLQWLLEDTTNVFPEPLLARLHECFQST